MRGRTSLILAIALVMVVAGLQAAPARAEFPERNSIIFVDANGDLMECVDFGRCLGGTCPAQAFFAGRSGSCSELQVFAPGKASTSCRWRNVDWSFFAPNTRAVEMDLVCSKWGDPFFGFDGYGTGSCAAAVTYKRLDQYGENLTFNEGYSGVTVGPGLKCGSLFSSMSEREIAEFDLGRYLERRR